LFITSSDFLRSQRSLQWRGNHMAGRIGSVQKAADGPSYGFVIFDTQDRACLYLGFSTWARCGPGGARVQGLPATAIKVEAEPTGAAIRCSEWLMYQSQLSRRYDL
jgi:hypothetical protein